MGQELWTCSQSGGCGAGHLRACELLLTRDVLARPAPRRHTGPGPTGHTQRGNKLGFSLGVFALGNIVSFHKICCLR